MQGRRGENDDVTAIKVDKIQNGRPSAVIHLDRPDIAAYHENRSR